MLVWVVEKSAGRVGQQSGILSSSRPNVLEYPPTLRFWMVRWSRDQPQPESLFQRLREAEKRDPGNEVEGAFVFATEASRLHEVKQDKIEIGSVRTVSRMEQKNQSESKF